MSAERTPSGRPENATPDVKSPDRLVRYTVDLPRSQHRELKIYAIDADTDASVVVRTLLALLLEDPDLSKRVRARIDGIEPG